jgi:hypothetical protein
MMEKYPLVPGGGEFQPNFMLWEKYDKRGETEKNAQENTRGKIKQK